MSLADEPLHLSPAPREIDVDDNEIAAYMEQVALDEMHDMTSPRVAEWLADHGYNYAPALAALMASCGPTLTDALVAWRRTVVCDYIAWRLDALTYDERAEIAEEIERGEA